ncbi:Bax inhibitor-1 family protein [Chungangia koreensis]|uniref:Bax inhibitor-1 family protein n=1 Tax=Chungangia koreensis TaxID=752657 RepID=A0ABV8WZQ6_9LACT
MYPEHAYTRTASHDALKKVLSFFSVLWLLSGIGVILGQFVPYSIMMPLMVVEFVLIIAMIFVRRAKRAGKGLAVTFALISGITLYPALTYYVGSMGGEIVLATFISTAVIFAAYGLIGYRMNKNLVGWSSYLFIAVIALAVIMLLGFFIPFSSTLSLVISMGAVLLFSLYTVYDFNQIRHQYIEDEDIPFIAIGLYLDFINLFLHLLRIINYFNRN